HKLSDPSGADRWMTAVARNVCLRFRGRGPQRELPVADVPDEAVEVELDRDDLADLLDGALMLLPPTSRDVLLQRYVEERSTAEIATTLGVSPEAVSMRLARGKLALRRALDEAEWRSTGIWCSMCGAERLLTRRERNGAWIAFRCPACDPDGRSAVFPLDNPVFATLVGTCTRPTSMFGRVGDWALGYWAGGDGAPAACTRCAGPVTVRAHTRTDTPTPTRGLFVQCASCGEELWSSLVGIAMAVPEVRALRRRDRRAHAEQTESRDVMTVAFATCRVAFDRRTFRLLGTS
ncbi:MAG TPA: RNA polymerase sigma factor, partial [Gaiellaceae bacterium]|nr:RNA polymerase sigma factor [Gaiellaceae bacterium]